MTSRPKNNPKQERHYMLDTVSTSATKTGWERPSTRPDATLENRTSEDIALWSQLVDRVILTARENGWNKAEVARRIDVPDSTFSGWFSGQYKGRFDKINALVERWLEAASEAAEMAAVIPQSPPFIRTKAAMEIFNSLAWAQTCPDFVAITLAAGMGKTITSKHYAATRPHVFHATMSPHTKTVHGMLMELAIVMDVLVHNPAKLVHAIGKRLNSNADDHKLLIVDEAQNLTDDAINQLRHFVDVQKCGVALVGNNEIYGRFTKRVDGPSYAQVKSRVGRRLTRDKPHLEDIKAFISAWGVSDPNSVKFLTGIGLKGGALRQIDKTMKLATIIACGNNRAVTTVDIQDAWRNRDVDEMA